MKCCDFFLFLCLVIVAIFVSSDGSGIRGVHASTVSTVEAIDNEINYNINGCNPDRLAIYKVVLHTYWTRELFPKHYPDWRPPAQWTKTFGECMDKILFYDFSGSKM